MVGLSPGWAAPALLSLAASQAPGLGAAMGSQPAHASSLLLLQPVGKSRNTDVGSKRRKLPCFEPAETFLPAPG